MIRFAQVHKSGRLNMKPKMKKRPVFQVILKHGRDDKLAKIAAYRGVDRSSIVKAWIDQAYARLPVEAQ